MVTMGESEKQSHPFIVLAVAFMLGIACGAAWPRPAIWLLLALGPVAASATLAWRGRSRMAMHWGLLAVVLIGAAWSALAAREVEAGAQSIEHELGSEPRLASVTGTVVDEPRLSSPQRGAFGRFSYARPGTLFTLELDSIVRAAERVPVSGRLLVRLDGADHRVQPDHRIAATGWMAPIEPPRNPGELNYRALMREQGVVGRLSLASRGNWRSLEDESAGVLARQPVATVRRAIAEGARSALRMGMLGGSGGADAEGRLEQRRRLALLEVLLLGRWTVEAREINEAFREVGLAHLMAISGAHLGILLGLVWLMARLVIPHPRWAAWCVLGVLAIYLLAIPMRVPIVRAAIMAGLFCAGYATGRRVPAMGMLALAAVVALIWRPMDLFSPGFQLSFGVVAALLLFTQPVAHWLWPPPTVEVHSVSLLEQLARRGVDYVAVSLVAFGIALPLVAYHFELVNPLSVLMSVLALPVVTALLGLGYLKILLGVFLPSVSALLAGPLAWVTDTMLGLVEHGGRWPGAAIELMRPPPIAWVVAVLMIVVALFSGSFARRKWALAVCMLVLAAWTFALERPDLVAALTGRGERAALRVNMFSVGGGSSYLVRAGEDTFMFDCGSQAYLDVGERSIVPALRRLGVRRIDTLFISHADLDHYCGALAVVDAVEVGEVRVPPQLLRAAERRPNGAVRYLVAQLRQRGVRIEPTARGWSQRRGETQLDAHWPPRDFEAQRANDASLVLSVARGGCRVLFTGDIDEAAMAGLLQQGGLNHAEVVELPHHGSFNARSADWLAAVSPHVALQSSGARWGRDDPWAGELAARSVQRLVSEELGMVELTLPRDGEAIRWRAFRDERGGVVE